MAIINSVELSPMVLENVVPMLEFIVEFVLYENGSENILELEARRGNRFLK